jgi:hypothetical protein
MKKTLLTLSLFTIIGLSANAQNIYTIAGNNSSGYTGDGSPATAAQLYFPSAVSVDATGNIYIADYGNNVIRKVNSAGIISTVAGNNVGGYSGDGGQASAAELDYPTDVAFDAAGNMYVADASNGVIRMVNSAGIINTFAGGGSSYGDGGQATAAQFAPEDLAFDAVGNLYVCDATANVIRKINTAGIISTVAGVSGLGLYTGDGGPATAAQLNKPTGIVFDAAGNLYIADNNNYVVRMVNTSGIISTFAGTTEGYSGDGGAATAAQLYYPVGLAVDAAGNLFINDASNYRIRIVNSAGIISTYAGNGGFGYTGDGGPALAAEINNGVGNQSSLACDAQGNLYIPDFNDNAIRKVTVPIPGAALNFDGSANNQINIGTSMTAALGTFSVMTLEAWVNPSSISNSAFGEIIGNYSSPAGAMQFMLRQQQDAYAFFVDPGSGFQQVTSSAGTATANVWQHVTGVWDGSNLMIYVNGVLQGTQTGVAGPHLNSTITNSVVMGYETAGGGEGFVGNMDEVRVWSSVRTQCQINTSMNCELASTDRTGLFTYYKFNEGIATNNNSTVTTLIDSSGNGYNGTLNAGFALTGTTSNWVAQGGVTTGVSCGPVTNPTITVNNANVCAGTNATLTASGASTYSWSTSATTASIVPSPTVTTSYTVTGANANYCMASAVSTVSVNTLPTITVNSGTVCAGSSFTISPSGASTYTYSSGNAVVTPTANATYTVTGTNTVTTCSNMAVASVTVNALPNNATTLSGVVITATQGGATYKWINCANNTVIAGATAQSYTATANGNYKVVINNSTCSDTSACVSVTTVGIAQYGTTSNLQVYPNPNNGTFTIETNNPAEQILQIFDVNGRLLLTQTIKGKTIISTNDLINGVYNINIFSSEGVVNRRLIITR